MLVVGHRVLKSRFIFNFIPKAPAKEPIDVKLIAGATVGVLVVIVLVILLIIFRRKVANLFKTAKKPKNKDPSEPCVLQLFF